MPIVGPMRETEFWALVAKEYERKLGAFEALPPEEQERQLAEVFEKLGVPRPPGRRIEL